ncbi:carboxylesterase family protein [Mucilaginibacter paludis]|uniref:Phospholipase/Carboxylesterase n=1 Tax=Mucilaginibacter paludis DSM 18603 TaxID=714943 RepID=H1YJ00_9SPHI|nr:prolyl oligopeptidase family serine peptidase [Mucilaginibacter paludis]EHQ27695.1 phospholipase/Carboxylesterase [Mucilaginibacter paludis DSM 18603]
MKKLTIILILNLAFQLSLIAQDKSVFRKGEYLSGTDTLPYRLMYPAHYHKYKKYPLVLFLHGAGQRGTDNEAQLAGVPKALIDVAGLAKYPCFILVPQCARKDVWVKFPHFPQSLQATPQPTKSARSTLELVDRLIKQRLIDTRRIYITGYSMGGEGAFDFLTRRPELFAAAIPVCSVADTAKAGLISRIPIWAFHGDQDDVNDVKYSRMMIEALKKNGGTPIYTEYPGVKHNSWLKAYDEPDLFAWLFKQRSK